MNENENFESLRRLLALKRHETPPPGYFNRFSGEVIARIRAGERESESATSWLLKLLQIFEAKPAFASSFAGALCLLLVFGIVYAEQSDQTPQPLLQTSQLSSEPLMASAASATSMPQPSEQNLFASSTSNSSPSSLQPLFSQNAFAQPVNFTLPGN